MGHLDNAPPWDIRPEPRHWTREESEYRLYQAPEKIEFVGGLFSNDRERMTALAMIFETMGLNRVVQLGKLEDWKSAIAERERQEPRIRKCKYLIALF
jgi:hypothetical protein